MKTPPRSRLHRIYYYLAAFDLITVVISFVLVAILVSLFQKSVHDNDQMANWFDHLKDIRRGAEAINRPGNRLFRQALDRDALAEQISQASGAFDGNLGTFRDGLREDIEPLDSEAWGRMQAAITRMSAAKSNMTGAALQIRESITSNPLKAGESMARMDEHYYEVLGAVDDLASEIRHVQLRAFEQQAANADRLQLAELFVAGLIFLMVVLAVFYGHRLTRRVKELGEQNERRLSMLVQQRTRDLEERTQQLRLADRLASIGTLAAGLGHDMNNILFPVRCRVEALSATLRDDEETVRELQPIGASLDYLQQLADGLRLLSLDPEDQHASNETTDLTEWWSEVNQLLKTALPRGATLLADVSGDLPALSVAPHQLTQAMFNLVVNAGEAIGGSGEVRLTTRAADNGMVELAVSDTGHGMTPEVLRQASDPFFTTKTRGMSTGLGLALVHGVVRGAGGTLSIESEPGRGTTVTVTLPTVLRAKALPPESRPVAAMTLDDPRTASIVSAVLESEGCMVRHDATEPDGARIWVLNPHEDRLASARAFADDDETRRIILVGCGGNAWDPVQAIRLDTAPNLSATRKAIREALADFKELPA